MKEEKQTSNINIPLTNGYENRSSIEVIKNSKGYNWSIKRYYKDNENIDNVLKEIEDTEQKLKERYGD